MTEQHFNSAEYLKNNPDVASAIQKGVFSSAWHHYTDFGRKEGRKASFSGIDVTEKFTPSAKHTKYRKLNICSLCDYKYLPKFLALYASLCQQPDAFTIHMLCIDDLCYRILKKLDFKDIRLFSLQEFENNDPELVAAKNNPPALYGDKYAQYCWCLTPYFINYVLVNYTSKNQFLVYIDADIFIYKPVSDIIRIIGDKSVGIHTHRFGGEFNNKLDTGFFNVGIVVFKHDCCGLEMSSKWKQWLLSQSHEYYGFYGKCGDQKYLDLIYELYTNYICIFDENMLHAAPWCADNIGNREISFYHFSHFRMDDKLQWHDSTQSEWNPSAKLGIAKYYEQYANYYRHAMNLINE